jgi:hypothetical protein
MNFSILGTAAITIFIFWTIDPRAFATWSVQGFNATYDPLNRVCDKLPSAFVDTPFQFLLIDPSVASIRVLKEVTVVVSVNDVLLVAMR